MKKLALLFGLAALVAVGFGCGTESETSSPNVLASPSESLAQIGCPWEPTPQWIIDSLDYDTFQGSIAPGMGGFMTGTLPSWPTRSQFTIQVPPTALPGLPGSPSVTFTVKVPKYQSYLDYEYLNDGKGLPLIMLLEPSHINFHDDITVYATYMPWTGLSADDFFEILEECNQESDGEIVDVYDQRGKVIIKSRLPHFSRWEWGGTGGGKIEF